MTWSQIAQYPVALPYDTFYASDTELCAAETGGKIYTFASTGVASSTVPYQFYEYNPATNIWTAKATPGAEGNDNNGNPGRVTGATLCAGNGHVYRVGGVWQSGIMVYSNALFLDYNISTNTWTTRTVQPTGETVVDSAYCNGKVWIATQDANSNTKINLHSWDPASNAWTTNVATDPVTGGTNHRKMIAIGNALYFFITKGDPSSLSLWKFDTATLLWTEILPIVFPSKIFDQATMQLSYTAGNPYPSIADLVSVNGDVIQIVPYSDQGVYGPEDISVSISAPRPFLQNGEPVPWYTLFEYITSQGLSFYNNSQFQDYFGLVGYGGSAYFIAPFALSSNSHKQDQRSFKYTPDGISSAPSSVVPAAGATIGTDVPVISGTVTGSTDRKNIEWQIAKDSAFSIGLRTIFQTDETTGWFGDIIRSLKAPDSAGGTKTQQIIAGTSQELTQGTWYIRSRTFSGGYVSPWSATNSFTVSHPPALAPSSPTNDQTLDFRSAGAVTFQWTFSDTSPTDVQTAFQIVVELNSDGTLLLDTGKISSQVGRSYNWNLPSTRKDQVIRWKIRGWDSDDIVGPYSNYSLFRMSDKPTVTITAPAAGSQVATGQPTVTWTFAASAGRTQASYRVRFYLGSTVVYDSGTIAGSDTTYTPASQVLDVGTYTVVVDLTDNRGLTGSASVSFSTSFNMPNSPAFTLSQSKYSDLGYIAINWTAASQDYAHESYVIYRRVLGDTEWEQVAEVKDILPSYSYHDYSAGSRVTYEYVVTQRAWRFSSVIESSRVIPGPQPIVGISDQYVLVHPTDPSKSITLRGVTSDNFTEEWESEELQLIGRGRHMDYGSRWGYKGQLVVKLRGTPGGGLTARQQREMLLDLVAERVALKLRNPFGDVWNVSVGDIQVGRIAGVGLDEFVDVTIPYSEVS